MRGIGYSAGWFGWSRGQATSAGSGQVLPLPQERVKSGASPWTSEAARGC